jgi:hypothetical protein
MVTLACAIATLCGCDELRKKHAPEPVPVSNEPPKTGHSVTVLKPDAGTGSGSGHVGSGAGSGKKEHLMGGNGSPAARADDGRIHGPGGPVYMGRGVTCDAAHDHCLRENMWFSVNNIQAGKLYRALPVFEFEKKWWTWRGEPADQPVRLYKTQIAGNAKIAPGTSVIWFSSETSDGKWADSEYEALTSSRWEAGVVESQQSPTVVMIKGYGAATMDTIRLITETRAP